MWLLVIGIQWLCLVLVFTADQQITGEFLNVI